MCASYKELREELERSVYTCTYTQWVGYYVHVYMYMHTRGVILCTCVPYTGYFCDM